MKTSESVIRRKKRVEIWYVKMPGRKVFIQTVQQDLNYSVRAKC